MGKRRASSQPVSGDARRCPFCDRLMFRFPYIDKRGRDAVMFKCYVETCIIKARKTRNLRGRNAV